MPLPLIPVAMATVTAVTAIWGGGLLLSAKDRIRNAKEHYDTIVVSESSEILSGAIRIGGRKQMRSSTLSESGDSKRSLR